MNESNISKIANPLFPILPDSAIPCPLLTPSLNENIDSGVRKHPFAGFGTVMEDIKRSAYTKNQPFLLGAF